MARVAMIAWARRIYLLREWRSGLPARVDVYAWNEVSINDVVYGEGTW